MKRHQTPDEPTRSPSQASATSGRYRKMFPCLPEWQGEGGDTLQYLETLSSAQDFFYSGTKDQNDKIKAGYTYLAQFITHDLTFDTTSVADRQADPDFIQNYRTPALDLDSMYGQGPMMHPYRYEPDGATFVLVPIKSTIGDDTVFWDLPRFRGQALIADPRNDENVLVSQLLVAFMMLHNKFVRDCPVEYTSQQRFAEARRQTIWHFQYVIIHDYLELLKTFKPLPEERRKQVFCGETPFIPVEFAGAAFRFGHSQINAIYNFNLHFVDPRMRMPVGGKGLLPDPRRTANRWFFVDWSPFFEKSLPLDQTLVEKLRDEDPVLFDADLLEKEKKLRILSRKISPRLVDNLKDLAQHGETTFDLAKADLRRGWYYRLPSGQGVAEELGIPVLSTKDWDELKLFFKKFPDDRLDPESFKRHTPLWYYILAEAWALESGERLGPVGWHIVSETIRGLILADKDSFLNACEPWSPAPEHRNAEGKFTMVELLKLAGVFRGALVNAPSEPF